MTEVSIGVFNVLAEGLQAQLDIIATEFGQMPNNLLLRCVNEATKSELEKPGVFTEEEKKWLSVNGIARISEPLKDKDKDNRFLAAIQMSNRQMFFSAPWAKALTELKEAMNTKTSEPGAKMRLVR